MWCEHLRHWLPQPPLPAWVGLCRFLFAGCKNIPICSREPILNVFCCICNWHIMSCKQRKTPWINKRAALLYGIQCPDTNTQFGLNGSTVECSWVNGKWHHARKKIYMNLCSNSFFSTFFLIRVFFQVFIEKVNAKHSNWNLIINSCFICEIRLVNCETAILLENRHHMPFVVQACVRTLQLVLWMRWRSSNSSCIEIYLEEMLVRCSHEKRSFRVSLDSTIDTQQCKARQQL